MAKAQKGMSAFGWKFLERFGVYFVQFIISVVLARILGPQSYGVIAIVNVFIAFATVFVQNGLNSALIQKKQLSDLEISSVFYINLILASVLYLILFLCAPLIASLYENPDLTLILRVLGLMLLPCAITNIQTALVEKAFKFKSLFFCSFSAAILSGVAGITAAYMDMGVWALVIQQMVYRVVVLFALLITQRWWPKLQISWQSAKPLIRFGWKILLAALIDVGYKNLRELIIGKKYDAEALAYYDKGKRFPEMMISNVNGSIQSVLLPKISAKQDDVKQVKNIVKSAIKTSSFFVMPMMIGLAMVADSFIKVLYTEEWIFCVPYLQVFCFAYAFWPIHTANLQAITATGHSSKVLKLEVIKKTMGIAIIIATVWFGPLVMAIGYAGSSVVSAFINAFPNKKLIQYSFWEQIKDVLPCTLCALAMGGVVYLIGLLNLSPLVLLLIQLPVGAIFYTLLVLIFRLDVAVTGINLVKSKLFKRKAVKENED